ncbi:3-phosphoshikimate 1-carboxyvinyltransferase [Adhaeribacter sp. BT258]|uniref:3-phosphoshikimate 1-carboxyvinyltransferase n=1 Tax=Adhaeribacter terrigena TaxID=2793070 RepID=A0ABS1BXA5_9BACT|nr:3-phosphoshikimate 1-carboxyvinyltransferase [Adhaeribacter terrigena]MBK0401786.1 3-phosphoshikimate 1-carboxyvinyltransferase [Adhaeribacter terrigena]
MSGISISISHPTGILRGTVQLPASKSESNRALIIQALSPERITLQNLSDANDTVLLQRLLHASEKEINAEDAGTVMRFLTAYFSLTNQPKVLTGTERMCHRPIGILVDALRELGVEIKYLGQEGFPPLEIKGFEPKFSGKSNVKLRGDVSSQFISALLLCAPVLPHGLRLELAGKIASRPYIEMTLALMQQFGISSSFIGNDIEIAPKTYEGGTFSVEADWSAASYWYSLVALAKKSEILLTGLKENSLQGDSKVAELMKDFGVKTTFLKEGILLTKTAETAEKIAIDFSDIPDLAQTFAVLAAAKNIALEMTGLESLRIKETDRIAALQTELARFGATLMETKPGTFLVKNDSVLGRKIAVQTYHDHRMAMAFAPLALFQEIQIGNPEVVKKSYPQFWNELRKVGFVVEGI